ncbi:MAG: cytochrome C [Planctomycetaceae bacterium]|nr:cytochrome C [Planctomycetaceae bacterium]
MGFLRLLLFALSASLFTAVPGTEETSLRIPPKEPREALKTFRLQPGFRIELVAAEPLIRDPVAIDFDESGRMYVVEYPEFNEYSFNKGPKPSGAVKLLEDTNGDGRFDKSMLFLDTVAFPTAVACYDGGVFVGAAPDLLYCKDTNGDGRADVRNKVLTGFARDFAGGGLLNSFRWGLDNRIHIATSFAGGNIRSANRPDDEPVSIRSRGVLLDPRAHQIELTSGGGQHGMGIDDWGRTFLCSNVNPMQLLMYDGRYVARNPFFAPPAAAVDINGEGRLAELFRISPLEPWRIERSRIVAASQPDDEGAKPGGLFTSSSGITIYRGDAWPQEYRGNLFVGEVTNNLVYRAKLEASGVGRLARRADRDSEFLASTDIWFRPVQFANAPDGNLYVVDMYRELIEGAAFVPKRVLDELDASSGTDRGRIYRIVAVGRASQSAKRDVNLQSGDLPHKMATEQLVALLEHRNGWHRDTAARLLYERQDRRAVAALKELAANSDRPVGRVHAMHALDGLGQLTPEGVLPRLVDTHPEVRIHALKLSESIVNEAPALRAELYSMVNDPEQRVRYQLAFSLGAISPSVSRNEALAQLLIRDGDDEWLRTAVQSSLAQGAGDVLLLLSTRPQFRGRDNGKQMLQALAAQIGAQNRSSDLALLLKSLELIREEENAIKQAMTLGLFSHANDEVKQRFLAAGSGKLAELLSDLITDARKTAASNDATTDDRVDAIRTLALADFRDAEVQALFADLLQLHQSSRIQSVALGTLAKHDHPEVLPLLHNKWPGLSPKLRVQAMEAMFARTDWTLATLDAVVKKQIARTDISQSRLAMLKDHHNPQVQQLARKLLRTPTLRRQEVVETYRSSLQMKGNADRGKTVFKGSCSACHKMNGIGNSVGADLAGIGNRPAETILTNILDPNRDVKPKFANYVLVTKDGRTVTGVIIEETANSIRLVRADGTDATVLRIHIESLRNTGISFMPEGLEKQIDPQAMADLLTFLATDK